MISGVLFVILYSLKETDESSLKTTGTPSPIFQK